MKAHARIIQKGEDGWKIGELHLLFLEDCFVMVKSTWKSIELLDEGGDPIRGGLFSVSAEMHVGFMEYTYLNELHAASVVRSLDHFQSPRASWEIWGSCCGHEGFRAGSEDNVIVLIRQQCCQDDHGIVTWRCEHWVD